MKSRNAVINALGIVEQSGKKIEDTLGKIILRTKRYFCFLDNCEHLVHSVCQLLRNILTYCPKVSSFNQQRSLAM
ncbi:MAG: hypothetical protein IPG99_02760 [Ignavibacteria bacterium]|nr:hypothetical protein [Ignavibacteria bacterium]